MVAQRYRQRFVDLPTRIESEEGLVCRYTATALANTEGTDDRRGVGEIAGRGLLVVPAGAGGEAEGREEHAAEHVTVRCLQVQRTVLGHIPTSCDIGQSLSTGQERTETSLLPRGITVGASQRFL